MSIRCKVAGCDPDPCGVCRRCGTVEKESHDWTEAERDRPCFRREVCSTCSTEREQPDHDWQPGQTRSGESALVCARCDFTI